ncbi:MAG TPA: ribosome maturation factor RimP [Bacteroidota bacterium]|nr:ribosome maturation factor RimP [Bacteroidota bacterium]
MSLASEVETVSRPIVERLNAFLIDVVARGHQGNRVLELFVDTADGVTTDQCAAISRELAAEFDRIDLVKGRYQLVVSSPGLDRPLRFPYQYPRHVGRSLKVIVTADGGTAVLEGTLAQASGEEIVLEEGTTKRHEIRIADILECTVRTPW